MEQGYKRIFPSLYIGTYDFSTKKKTLKQLMATHIINCSGSQNTFEEDYEFFNVDLSTDPVSELEEVCKFIDEGKSEGIALIYE